MVEVFAGSVKGFAVFRPRTARAKRAKDRFLLRKRYQLSERQRIGQPFFLNSSSSPLAATLILSPGLNSPSSSLIESGSSNFSWMVRLSGRAPNCGSYPSRASRSEEHTSELQSPCNLVCRLLLEKKKPKIYIGTTQQ